MRSTWPAVGSGRDGLLLCSRNNAAVLPAPLAPLWSSDLVVPFSRRCLASIQRHLTLEAVITGVPVHLFGKQGELSPLNSFILYSSILALYVWVLARLLTRS